MALPVLVIWADTAGNIGYQAVGISPVRRTWSGLVPVPGDGRFVTGAELAVDGGLIQV